MEQFYPHVNPKDTKPYFERGTAQIFFTDAKPREMFVRGSIAWPEGSNGGVALVAGQDIKSREVILLGEFEFWSVEHFFEDDQLKFRGLSQFLNQNWQDFYCNHYYDHQPFEVRDRYYIQILKSKMINPKPVIVNVKYTDDKIADNILNEYLHLQRFIAPRDSLVFRHLMTRGSKDEKSGVHALRCLLGGFEFSGWRDPEETREEKVLWVRHR